MFRLSNIETQELAEEKPSYTNLDIRIAEHCVPKIWVEKYFSNSKEKIIDIENKCLDKGGTLDVGQHTGITMPNLWPVAFSLFRYLI